MAPRTRQSAARRINNQDGGVPLPAAHDDFYGENNEIVPDRGGAVDPTPEEADDQRIEEDLWEQLYNVSSGPNSSAQKGSAAPAPNFPRTNLLGTDEIGPLGRTRPPLPPNYQPHQGDVWNLTDQEARRKLVRGGLPNPYETPYASRRHPSEPPSTLASKYGMAGGYASVLSNRTFSLEDDLFDSADVRTPVLRPTPHVVRPESLPPQSQPGQPEAPTQQPPPVRAPILEEPEIEQTVPVDQRPVRNADSPAPPLSPAQSPSPDQALTQQPIVDDLPPQRAPSQAPSVHKLPTPSENTTSSGGRSRSSPMSTVHTDGSDGGFRSLSRSVSPSASSTQYVPQMDVQRTRELSDRMAYTKPDKVQGPKDPYPFTTQSDLTPEQIQRAEDLRQRMRLPNMDDGTIKPNPPFQKPKPPLYPDVNQSGPQPSGGNQSKAPTRPPAVVKDVPRPPPQPSGGAQPKAPTRPPAVVKDIPRPPPQPSGGTQTKAPIRPPAVVKDVPLPPLQQGRAPRGPVPPRPEGLIPPGGPSYLDTIKEAAQEFAATVWRYWWLLLALVFAIVAFQASRDPEFDLSEITGAVRSRLPNWPSLSTQSAPESSEVNKVIRDSMNESESEQAVIVVPKDKDGKSSVPYEVWENIKAYSRKDKDLLSEFTGPNWTAIKERLEQEGYIGNAERKPIFTNKTGMEIAEGWKSWLTSNQHEVTKLLGPSVKEEVKNMTEKERKATLDEVNKTLKDKNLVTRDEFDELVDSIVKEGSGKEVQYLSERVKELEEKLEKYKHDPPPGMSKSQMAAIVEATVKKYVNDLKLDAAASAGSRATLGHLSGNVNFFSVGSGAVIDPTLTSPKWKVPRYKHKSKQWYDRDGYKPLPAVFAIMPWTEEGECFCAGPDIKGRGVGTNNVSIIISRDIIPQHLVVEHILPGATLDAGAMPKDIEVWATFEDLHLRQTVQAWSEAQFPNTPAERILHQGFVKIGQMTYEDRTTGDGIQLHRLNRELENLNAQTNHVVVRALNNYGADHTCFYRIRLYGEVMERNLGFDVSV
ncbi:uncharacterized protein JN550_002522 [Neoarthrinium moseri]|uniref:uncharacterized protein n=1 Tax=Neoarthrinium moseri TaxID=1658444 RepID=UPI001FDE4477|nr:uncharacterized protein JN550_002522 [Neoarthrinium moseri]KAI1875093.1 hypothetical protein JN550_002522 [Neoarthrinium moseri]